MTDCPSVWSKWEEKKIHMSAAGGNFVMLFIDGCTKTENLKKNYSFTLFSLSLSLFLLHLRYSLGFTMSEEDVDPPMSPSRHPGRRKFIKQNFSLPTPTQTATTTTPPPPPPLPTVARATPEWDYDDVTSIESTEEHHPYRRSRAWDKETHPLTLLFCLLFWCMGVGAMYWIVLLTPGSRIIYY